MKNQVINYQARDVQRAMRTVSKQREVCLAIKAEQQAALEAATTEILRYGYHLEAPPNECQSKYPGIAFRNVDEFSQLN